MAGPCKLTVKRTETAITWTSTATSRAGVKATVTGKASLRDFSVAGAKIVKGRFLVTDHKAFTIVAYVLSTTKAPRYVDATPQGTRPHKTGPKMQKAGKHLWKLKVTISTKLRGRTANWTAGVRVGNHLFTIPLTVQR